MANPYTWTEPVTERSSGAELMTYEDMNRITVNLAWLFQECKEQGITISGTVYPKRSWTQNDIVTVSNWTQLLDRLANVYNAVAYTPATIPDNAMTYTNINQVETIELECYEILAAYARIPNMNHYIGDRLGNRYLYAGDPFNAGGRYD